MNEAVVGERGRFDRFGGGSDILVMRVRGSGEGRENGFELGLMPKSFGVMNSRTWLCGYTDPRTWMTHSTRAKRASVFRGKMSDICIATLHTGTSYTHVQSCSVVPASFSSF